MRDPRFVSAHTSRGHAVTSPIHRIEPTEDALFAKWEQDVIAEEIDAGRRRKDGNLIPGKSPLTREELSTGVKHPDSRTPADYKADQERRARDMNPAEFETRSPEEIRNAMLADQIERNRVKNLPPLERAKYDSDQRLAAERKSRADTEARAHLLSQPEAVALIADLERLIRFAKHDETLEARDFEELLHQKLVLLKTADVKTISQNVKALTARLLQGAEETLTQLQVPIDRAAMRRDALIGRRMAFDRQPEHLEQRGLPMVRLVYAGQEKLIHRAQFDGMEVPTLLKAHFNVGEQP